MYKDIGTASGVIAVMAIMWRFMNVKIEKKQNKDLCDQIHGSIEKGLHAGEKKFDKIMDKLDDISKDNERKESSWD